MAAMGVKVTVLNLAAYQQALAKHATPNGRFLTFPDEAALRDHLAQVPVPYDAVVGTYYGSVYWLPKQRPPECAYGYYIQDFEPLFFSETDERHQHALLSYTAHKDLQLITKTAWNQRAVADATGRVPTVIGCSVNVDLFAPSEERALAPIDRPLRIAAMLRPASAYRAPARTLAVFEEVLRRYPTRVTVHTFGTSDDQLAANCLARPWITNHGHLPPERVAALLARCDIFVDFSDYQAMGLSLLEAMASGCAVVGPINGGATAFLHDGVNGLLADTTSIDDCVEKTIRLVGDRDLRGNLQRRAIDDANTHVPEGAALNILNALFTPAELLIGGIS
jgi:glycosyltransferase involved in cell wall biosynthesis